ncbi:WhiB family transcriptional regulator [Streptomyces sp. SID7803]|nr:WhiB family transcriptional regulator [Streptomyces sp. SID7803]
MENWRMHAACRDADPDLFFPIGSTGPALVQAEEAKAVCRRCPRAGGMPALALENNQDSGVWGGGLGENERRALKRRSRRQSHRSG